jgi:hypothetical protein
MLWVMASALLWALAGVESAQGAAPRRELLVHAGERYSEKISPIWVALVEPPLKEGQGERTVVLTREEIGDKKWQQLPEIPARVVGLTNHGSELVVMLEGKDRTLERRTWAWFSVDWTTRASRFSYGPPLPQSVKLVGLGGEERALYALGILPPDVQAGKGAATTQSAQPARPRLFVLEGDKWAALEGAWPKEAAGAAELASLHVIAGVPHVAVPTGQETVRIYRFARDPGEWLEVEAVKLEAEPRSVKLLDQDDRPALWVQTDAAGMLWSRKHELGKVQLSGATPKADEVDATVSSDVRLFFQRDGKAYEQHINWDGTATGQPVPVEWARPRSDPTLNLLTTVFMTVLAVLVVSTLLRRRSMARDEERDRSEPEE